MSSPSPPGRISAAAAVPPSRIGASRPFLVLLVLSLAALGLVNRGLQDQGLAPLNPMIWGLYGATWLLLLLCGIAAFTHHHRAMRREERLLSLLLTSSLAIDLVEVNVRLVQSRVMGLMLLLHGALLLVALLALFTYLYWRLDGDGSRRCFWWIPPPGCQWVDQGNPGECKSVWSPGFVDYLYLSFTVGFSFFPHVEPIRPSARLLVIAQLIAVFDVDLILLARAVSLIPV